ncbi:MAG: glycerophosphoryl diester phosphodiesterase membrane domain-containing protein, partial [Eubacterium sp.]
MERKQISYKRFFRDTLGLLKFNFWPLAIFELIYCFCGSTIIFPVAGFILKHALSATGLFYITGFNVTQLARHPLLWIAAFYVLIEFTTLTVCFNESIHKRKVQAIPLIREGFKQAIRIAKPKNFMMILYLMLIIPFVNLLVTSNFIKDLSVPSFIMDYIWGSVPLSIIFITLVALLAILVVRLLFVFHLFTLEGKSFFAACRSSLKLLKGRFFRSLIRFFLWNLFIGAISILVVLISYFILLLPINLVIENVQNAP